MKLHQTKERLTVWTVTSTAGYVLGAVRCLTAIGFTALFLSQGRAGGWLFAALVLPCSLIIGHNCRVVARKTGELIAESSYFGWTFRRRRYPPGSYRLLVRQTIEDDVDFGDGLPAYFLVIEDDKGREHRPLRSKKRLEIEAIRDRLWAFGRRGR